MLPARDSSRAGSFFVSSIFLVPVPSSRVYLVLNNPLCPRIEKGSHRRLLGVVDLRAGRLYLCGFPKTLNKKRLQ